MKTEDTKFKCPDCGIVQTQRFFMIHYKKHHGGFPPGFEDAEKFICEECPEQFLTTKGMDFLDLIALEGLC